MKLIFWKTIYYAEYDIKRHKSVEIDSGKSSSKGLSFGVMSYAMSNIE